MNALHQPMRTLATLALTASVAFSAPLISRLTPPSDLFSYGDPNPIIARFLPGQRFDLQTTVQPDAGTTITAVTFAIDDVAVAGSVAMTPATVSGLPANTTVATLRAYSNATSGVHTLTATATQSDGSMVTATGNFEVVHLGTANGKTAKNIIFMIGDGFGIAHRTAARIMLTGVSQGKAIAPLAMEQFPVSGLVHTHSLNSIVTDSAPGASCYSTGNKNNNNQEGVFPDDTTDAFDNPRTEYIGEYMARTHGKSLGIVTTADVFDATPAAFAVHTANRGAGTGICDQYLDESTVQANLSVLLGGGRKWFLPAGTAGSARSSSSDYVLPAELATGWGIAAGKVDTARDLIADFEKAGFAYAPDATTLLSKKDSATKLLGLFAYSNMNVALDKIGKRRGTSTVVDDFGFPDQPMLDEMTDAAIGVLSKDQDGFVLMVEAASIDKQAHNMDTERWILDTIEFDRAIDVARQFALRTQDTLVIITADHECAGVNIIGASRVTQADLAARATAGGSATKTRDEVVGTYDAAGFPYYDILPDGYPASTDVDRRMLIGYAANADRNEDWLSNPLPIRDSQQPLNGAAPLNTHPSNPSARDIGGFTVTGQVPGSSAVHTASDIPVAAIGPGAGMFTGVMDNTDVFFKAMTAALRGAPGEVANTPAIGQRTASDRLVNLSTRGFVGLGQQALVIGFVIDGDKSREVLIRGLGPVLANYGLQGVLADPTVKIYNGAGALVATNTDWQVNPNLPALTSATATVGAFMLPAGAKDSSLLVSLPAGAYSAYLESATTDTGIGMLEIYETP